jgi:hypothetical protein
MNSDLLHKKNPDNFSHRVSRHKAEYLKSLVNEQDLVIHAAYGSSKDINVYSALDLKSDQIFIIGKPSRRQSNLQVSWIPNGYAEHLAVLTSPGGSRPAEGNARMVIPKGTTLGPPGLQRRRTFKSASRTTSYPFGAGSDATSAASQQASTAATAPQGTLINFGHYFFSFPCFHYRNQF